MITPKHFNARKLVMLALLTAIVVIFQSLGAFVKFGPFSISLVLMPIAVGAALIGAYAGAWLGLAFGFVVLMSGDAGVFLAINPPAAIFIVLMKGLLAGLAAGFTYRLFANKSRTAAAVAAAAVCPIVNTGVFLAGTYVFFLPVFTEAATAAGFANAGAYIILMVIGANFLVELALNLILSPVIIRLIQYGLKTSFS